MEKESFTIVNENEHDIVGELLRKEKKGKFPCIIFAHGLLEDRKAAYIKNLSTKFLDEGFAVLTYDSSQSLGQSGGKAENVTISQRVSDLTRVVSYARRRSFISDDKIIVFGHCYGAMAALAMEGFQNDLLGLVLVSTPARIEESQHTRKSSHDMMKIRLKRYFHIEHDNEQLRINYSFYEDGMKIDMDRAARNLKTPVLFIHGAKDESIPLVNSERLHARAVGPKKLLVIDSMEHEIKGPAMTKIYNESLEFLQELI